MIYVIMITMKKEENIMKKLIYCIILFLQGCKKRPVETVELIISIYLIVSFLQVISGNFLFRENILPFWNFFRILCDYIPK